MNMKKLTKLLSVFVIAGVVGAGTAALAGCGEPKHEHTPVEHAATCTEGKYYTCDSDECAGKYYSDEACTTEIKLEDVAAGALGHTEKYTDKGDGTHGITCEEGDLTETTEAHKDDNGDYACDKCKVKYFPAGKYFNAEQELELEIKANGKVVYNEKEYTLSAISAENSATFTVGEGATAVEYTVTGTASGLTVSYGEVKDAALTLYLVDENADFVGVYTGELAYTEDENNYKITKFEITAGGMVKVTEVQVVADSENPKEPATYVTDGTESLAEYNSLTVGNFEFVVTKAKDGAATELTVIKHAYKQKDVTAVFTVTEDKVTEVPAVLPLDAGTFYTAKVDQKEYTLVITASGNNVNDLAYSLNEYLLSIVGGNATDGYLLYSSEELKNYVVKISADKSAVDLYKADGTTKIATLALATPSFPALKTDGTNNSGAVVDVFNSSYAYYEVEKDGWYIFTGDASIESEFNLFTKVVDGEVMSSGSSVLTVKAGKSTVAVELKAGAYVAVERTNKDNAFTASYSATKPDPAYTTITNGKYSDSLDFAGGAVYKFRATAPAAGRYYVSVVNTSYLNRGPYVKIGDKKYGNKCDTNLNWSEYEDGLVYSADLTENQEVKMEVGCDNEYLPGEVTIYFETQAEYEARQTAENTEPTFSGAQLGEYVYEEDYGMEIVSHTYTVSADGIVRDDYPLTFAKNYDGKLLYNNGDCVIKFNEDGTLSVNDNGSEYTAKKPVIFEESYTAAQQGVYSKTYTDAYTGSEATILIKIEEKSVTLGSTKLKYAGKKGDVYEWSDGYDSIFFSFAADGSLSVTADNINRIEEVPYTAAKVDPANLFNGFTAAQQGVYGYTPAEGNSVVIKVSEDSVTYNGDELSINLIVTDGVYTCGNYRKIKIKFEAGNVIVTEDGFSEIQVPYTATKVDPANLFNGFTAAQQGVYGYTPEGKDTIAIKVSENLITYNGSELSVSEIVTDGVYTCSNYYGESIKIKFEAGNVSVTKDDFSEIQVPYTATKVDPANLFNGFTADQQGAYEYVAADKTITITVGEDYVLYQAGNYPNELHVNEIVTDGVYTCSISGYVIKIKFEAGNVSVTKDGFSEIQVPYTATKKAAPTKVENGGQLALGENEITSYVGEFSSATVYLTASDTLPAGNYNLIVSGIWEGSLKVNGEMATGDGKTVTVTLGTEPIEIYCEKGFNGNVKIEVVAKA